MKNNIEEMISIIIPLYNNEKYIIKCIESILSQTYRNYEIIIIDDGSTDNGYNLIKNKYKCENIHIVSQQNAGPSKARNRGIKMAKGKWILFLDSDDQLSPKALSILTKDYKNSDFIVAGWRGNYVNKKEYYGPNQKCIIKGKELEDLVCYLISNGTLYKYENTNIQSIEGPVAKLYNTKLIKENKILFPEELNYAEDVVFNFNYLQYCNTINVINEVVYEASRHLDSLSNRKRNWMETNRDFEKAIEKINSKKWEIEKTLLQRKFIWATNYIEENINIISYKEFNEFLKLNELEEVVDIETTRLSYLKKLEYCSIVNKNKYIFIILKIIINLKKLQRGNYMEKIGIITVYGENNYGNKLQNYACIKIYEKFGYDTKTIKVVQSRMILSNKEKMKYIVKKYLKHIPKYDYLKYQFIRENKFKMFSKKYLNVEGDYNTATVETDFLRKYKYLSIGSDQVWNDTDFNKNDINYFLLNDIDGSKIITLSPSFGKTSVLNENKNIFKKNLKKFKALSCREQEGAELVEEISGRKCKVTIDPTMALEKKQWEEIERKPSWSISSNFAFSYFLGGIHKYENDIRKYCKEHNLELVDILDKKNIAYTASPEEFLYLINNSKIVYTDSFHACVFSIIFGVDFVVLHRSNQESEMSSRISTLFSTFGINSVEYGKIYKPVEFKNREEILLNKREELEKYISNALI